MTEFMGKRVLIAGRGVSGLGAASALVRDGALFEIRDGAALDAPLEPDWDYVVLSPGIASGHPLVKRARDKKIPVISEIELGWRLNPAPVVAVTGTNGKTTTVGLIDEMLKSRYKTVLCGNVGYSYSRAASVGGYERAVVELSSFQAETIDRFKPHVAVITNISPDHLDRHGDMETYAALKCKIAARQTAGDFLILSADDIPSALLGTLKGGGESLYFSVRGRVNGAYLSDDRFYFYDEYICGLNRLRLPGIHNVKNALAAIAAARLSGVEREAIVEVLSTFCPDRHRCEPVGTVKGVAFYDDSKATNIGAALCGIDCVSGSTALIAGGSDKGCAYDALFERLPEHVACVAAIGETADALLAAAKKTGFDRIQKFKTLEGAVEACYKSGCKNVLLSPAAASFDMFSDYRDRGRAFVRAVEELKADEEKS